MIHAFMPDEACLCKSQSSSNLSTRNASSGSHSQFRHKSAAVMYDVGCLHVWRLMLSVFALHAQAYACMSKVTYDLAQAVDLHTELQKRRMSSRDAETFLDGGTELTFAIW